MRYLLKLIPHKMVWLLLIVGLAFFCRIALVPNGLPLLLYEDEPIYLSHSLGFGLGHWDIGYFKKPNFFLYFYGFFYWLFGFLGHSYPSWKSFVASFLENPTHVATIGRTVSVLLATASVLWVYAIGRKIFYWPIALIAAFFMAIDTTHLKTSPIVISDIPSLFFILAAVFFALGIAEKGRLKDYLLCSLMCALAASFKYNVFCVAVLIAGHLSWGIRLWQSRQETKNPDSFLKIFAPPRLWMSVALVPFLFLCFNPTVVTDFSTFYQDLTFEKRHMTLRNPDSVTRSWEPMVAFQPVFFKIVPRNIGWLLYVPALIGAVIIPFRHPVMGWVLLSFPLCFLMVVLQFRLVNAKYLLPLFPFFYLCSAYSYWHALRFLSGLIRFSWTRTPVFRYAGTILLIPLASCWTLYQSFIYVAIHSRVDTRVLASQYLETQFHKAAPTSPHVLLEPETLTLDSQILRKTFQLTSKRPKNVSPHPVWTGETFQAAQLVEVMKQKKPEYVVLNIGEAKKIKLKNGTRHYQMPFSPAYYQTLKADYQLLAVFYPYVRSLSNKRLRHVLAQSDFSTLYKMIRSYSSKRYRPGPYLLLLKRKNTEL